MQTRVSTKGQIILPSPIRQRLDIRAGDPIEVEIEDGRVVLTPMVHRSYEVRIVKDAITGLPVLTLGPNAHKLTSEQVAEILSDFP